MSQIRFLNSELLYADPVKERSATRLGAHQNANLSFLIRIEHNGTNGNPQIFTPRPDRKIGIAEKNLNPANALALQNPLNCFEPHFEHLGSLRPFSQLTGNYLCLWFGSACFLCGSRITYIFFTEYTEYQCFGSPYVLYGSRLSDLWECGFGSISKSGLRWRQKWNVFLLIFFHSKL